MCSSSLENIHSSYSNISLIFISFRSDIYNSAWMQVCYVIFFFFLILWPSHCHLMLKFNFNPNFFAFWWVSCNWDWIFFFPLFFVSLKCYLIISLFWHKIGHDSTMRIMFVIIFLLIVVELFTEYAVILTRMPKFGLTSEFS